MEETAVVVAELKTSPAAWKTEPGQLATEQKERSSVDVEESGIWAC